MPVEAARKIDKRILHIKTWSHIHVGSGTTLSRWEYFFHKVDGADQLFLLDQNSFANILTENPQLIVALTKAAEDSSSSLHKFLSEHPDKGLAPRLAKQHSQRALPGQLRNANKMSISELKLMPGSPSAYIPGSSVKGALRTAYLVDQFKREQINIPPRPNQKSREYLSALKRAVNRQFTDFNSPENKIFQHILVCDSPVIDPKYLGVAKVGSPSDSLSGGGKRGPQHQNKSQAEIYCEVLLSECPLKIEISTRPYKTNDYHHFSIKKLLELADKFYREVWELEKEFRNSGPRQDEDLKYFYNDKDLQPPTDSYLLRIGFGSGQLATSILSSYKKRYEREFGAAADEPLRNGPIYRTREDLLRRQPYPFSAKRALADDGIVDERGNPENVGQPLGWIIIPKKDLD